MKKWIFASALSMICFAASAEASPSLLGKLPDPAFNNLRYHYLVQSPRFVMETKILNAFKRHQFVYASANIRQQITQAHHLYETPKKLIALHEIMTA